MSRLKSQKLRLSWHLTSIAFKVFTGNSILSCFFSFFSCFLIVGLFRLIPAVIAQIFNPTVELIIPIGIPTKEAKAEI